MWQLNSWSEKFKNHVRSMIRVQTIFPRSQFNNITRATVPLKCTKKCEEAELLYFSGLFCWIKLHFVPLRGWANQNQCLSNDLIIKMFTWLWKLWWTALFFDECCPRQRGFNAKCFHGQRWVNAENWEACKDFAKVWKCFMFVNRAETNNLFF